MPKDSKADWDRHVFQSSYLHSGRYSKSRRQLVVQFGNAREISLQAPPELWDQLKSAPSPGKFYRRHIQPNFPAQPFEEK